MQVKFSLKPQFHSADVQSWLRIYVPGESQANTMCTGRASEVLVATLNLKTAEPGTPVCVW